MTGAAPADGRRPGLSPWVRLMAAALCNGAANGLLIMARPLLAAGDPRYLLWFAAALGALGLGMVGFVAAMRHLSLAVAYPALTGASIAIATGLEATVYGRSPDSQTMLGIGLILVGITLVSGRGGR